MVARATTEIAPVTLTVDDVAKLLNVSTRHVYRMADGGLMPRPLKLGNLNRWMKLDLEAWLAAGAKPVKSAGKRPVSGA